MGLVKRNNPAEPKQEIRPPVKLTRRQVLTCMLIQQEWSDELIAEDLECSLQATRQDITRIHAFYGTHSLFTLKVVLDKEEREEKERIEKEEFEGRY
jgi:hypothetical protein